MKFLKYILVWIPVILIASFIFGFSAQDGEESGHLSHKVAVCVADVTANLNLIEDSDQARNSLVSNIEYPIRKCAHMTEYAVLTLSIFIALAVCGLKSHKRYIFSFVLTVLFASSDEFHQRFVPGRCGTYKDVLVDSIGALLCLLILFLINRIINKRKVTKEI